MTEKKPYLVNAPDEELLSLIRHNDNAFEVLYNRYRPRLLYFVNTYLADPTASEEILQSFFTELYFKRDKLYIRSSFSAFLYASLRNRTLNYLRKQAIYKKHISNVKKEKYYVYNEAEAKLDIPEFEYKIRRLIKELPPKQQQIIHLKRQDKHSLRQIAGILKRPVNTVEKQLEKALLFLREGISVA